MEHPPNDRRKKDTRLDKREDSLEEQNQTLQKKAKSLEHTQRKLKERNAEVEKRAAEAEALVKQQAQKLHEIAGLSREQAEQVLLERLEREMADTVAARIQKHDEQL